MGTVVGRGQTGTGERPVAVLVPLVADRDRGWTAGSPEAVVDADQANAALVRAEAAGAGFLLALAADRAGGPSQADRIATALARLDALVGPSDAPPGSGPEGGPEVGFGVGLMVVDPAGGAAAAGPSTDGRRRGVVAPGVLAARLLDPSPPTGPDLLVAVPALTRVGGFDGAGPGLGWLDLADRLHRDGWALAGIDVDALPFVPALTDHLAPAERIAAEGRWLREAADGPTGRLRFERYRRAVLRAVGRARSADGEGRPLDDDRLAAIELAARERWRGQRPDEAQRGTGRRADWRHLLDPTADGTRRGVALLGLGPATDWRWLVDDGWAEAVTTELPGSPTGTTTDGGPAAPVDPVAPVQPVDPVGSIDTVIIGPEARRADGDVVARAGSSVAGRGSVVVLIEPVRRLRFRLGFGLGRGVGHRSVVRTLDRAGLADVRRYLALPDVDAPKRYVPLDHPGGPAWLAGPAPALASARLPRARRALRLGVRRLAPVLPEVFGGVVVVASAPPVPPGRTPSIVVTSGFDEGSRTVVLPLGPDGRPERVVKITARPAYRDNAEREHRLLAELTARVERPGLVPTPLGRLDDGEVHAVIESYAGRWTMTDVLNEQGDLASRVDLLDPALDAITELARTAAPGHRDDGVALRLEPWGPDGFDDLIGRWFDRLDEAEGPSPGRAALRRALAERSEALAGETLPIGVRHFDLGPWNMVLADADRDTDRDPDRETGGGAVDGGRSPITVVDWELAPPRSVAAGPVGADHLYFTKYWLHIAAGCRSIDDEQSAFAFLGSTPVGSPGGDLEPARSAAHRALTRSAAALGLSTGFLPLIEASVWAEAACYTRERRRGRGGDGGSPARYLDTLARHRARLLDAWPL